MLAGTSFVLAISRWPAGAPVTILLGMFAVYSAVALFWRSLEEIGRPWPALLIDTLIFLLSAFVTADQNLWFSSLFYVYLLIAAALLHGWREVWLVVVISMAFFLFTKQIGRAHV